MAKYPNHGGYSKMPTAGCGGGIIMIILTALCPPLLIVFWAIYSFFDSNTKNNTETLQSIYNVILILAILFILIIAPIITTLSIFTMGIEEAFGDDLIFTLITIAEIIGAWHLIIKKYKHKKMLENETEEERQIRIKKELNQQKEYEEQLKFNRLNTPTDHNDSKHVCNIYLYDKIPEEIKSEERMKIRQYISQGINLSQPTWEVYYYRIVEYNPNFPPKDK